MKMFRIILPLALLLGIGLGCNPEVEVYAVERELYLVSGILNPKLVAQHIRISKVFQTEGDAVIHAAENDVSAPGLLVTMSGDGKTWQSELLTDIPRDPGVFNSAQSLYKFTTTGAFALKAGVQYTLEIRKPDDPDFFITAYTEIPTPPQITGPGDVIYSPITNVYTYNSVDFSGAVYIEFNGGSGHGFEVRVNAEFWNGEEYEIAEWGPTAAFVASRGCIGNDDRGKYCFKIPERTVPNSMRRFTREAPGQVAFFDTLRIANSEAQLSKNAWVEVTAIDTFLTTMLRAETAFGFGVNLLIDKPEITNISGEHIGIFGSINIDRQYLFLGSCTKYIAGFIPVAPPNCE